MLKEIKNNPGVLPKIVVLIYRLGQKSKGFLPMFVMWKIIDTIFCKLMLNVELHPDCKIGYGLQIHHPYGIIINKSAELGNNVILRHHVTIGMDGITDECPIIGSNVEFGAGTSVIGKVVIGENTKIGAGAVVTKSFPDNSILIGVPAKNIAKSKKLERGKNGI